MDEIGFIGMIVGEKEVVGLIVKILSGDIVGNSVGKLLKIDGLVVGEYVIVGANEGEIVGGIDGANVGANVLKKSEIMLKYQI